MLRCRVYFYINILNHFLLKYKKIERQALSLGFMTIIVQVLKFICAVQLQSSLITGGLIPGPCEDTEVPRLGSFL